MLIPWGDAAIDAPPLDEGADYTFAPDEVLRDGDLVCGEGWSLQTVATPGHLSNHLCFGLDAHDVLFTGDHIMGWATTVIAPPDGSMGAYFESLEKLLARTDSRYLPTHGAPIDRPHRFVRAVRTHRLMRDQQILTLLEDGPANIRDLVETMYARVDKRLHLAAALNVLAHLIRLRDIGLVACDGDPTLSAHFRRI